MTMYPPGEAPQTFTPGDFLLTHGSSWIDRAIRLGQRLRYPADACYFNHAALVVSTDGDLVEALGAGVTHTHASRYTPAEYVYVDSRLGQAERADAARFGLSMVGTPYGWWTIASIVLTLLTPSRIRFDRPGTVICSGLVAAALGVDEWRPDPSHVMPAELAVRYGVQPPTPTHQRKAAS